MTAPPIPCVWADGVFKPLKRFHNIAASHYGEGEAVDLAPAEHRSEKSHGHQFAWLREAWLNLPENLAEQYPSPEHLRKRSLVQAGFFHETIVDAGSNAAALRVASAFRARDMFSIVVVRGPVVAIRDPMSQSVRAMGKAQFQASKTAIMEIVSDLIGVAPEALNRARAA